MTYIAHIRIVNMWYEGYIGLMAKAPVLTVKKLIAMSPDMVAAIDDYRFAERIGSEAEAIRRLIELGLQASKAEPKS